VQFENITGFARFRIDPRRPGSGLQNIRLLFENRLSGERVATKPICHLDRPRDIPVPFPAQEAGVSVWCMTVEYECDGLRHVLEGDVEMLVVHPRDAQRIADSLAINITNTINNGNASDVHVSQRALDDLARLATAENPFEELRRMVTGSARAWKVIELYGAEETGALPPLPAAARTDRITLDLGVRRISFFAARTMTFGRTREMNDISLRPPADATEQQRLPYRLVSRAHCFFEHEGGSVSICDGRRDELRVLRPSSGGTFWNGARICGPHRLSPGESGVLSFGAAECAGALAMDVKACSSASACTSCPHADRRWCGDGGRPSLMLSRRDGIPESFVALWSCFSLEDVDASFEGVVIFRKDGAFAWRRGRRCGWLVPGTSMQTDMGTVTTREGGK
jgi:hypothetical protein